MLKRFYKNILFNVQALRLLSNKSKYTGLLITNFIVVELCVFDGHKNLIIRTDNFVNINEIKKRCHIFCT